MKKAIALGQGLPRESPVGRARAAAVEHKGQPRDQSRGGRSRLQAAWAERLELRRRAGELAIVLEETISLRLADLTWYRPDFLVLTAEGRLEIHEVKGHWRDDARAKWKIAAELNRWASFLAITRGRGRDGQWEIEHAKAQPETATGQAWSDAEISKAIAIATIEETTLGTISTDPTDDRNRVWIRRGALHAAMRRMLASAGAPATDRRTRRCGS